MNNNIPIIDNNEYEDKYLIKDVILADYFKLIDNKDISIDIRSLKDYDYISLEVVNHNLYDNNIIELDLSYNDVILLIHKLNDIINNKFELQRIAKIATVDDILVNIDSVKQLSIDVTDKLDSIENTLYNLEKII
jgi:hypothetical protein